jgi:hypothetical protein
MVVACGMVGSSCRVARERKISTEHPQSGECASQLNRDLRTACRLCPKCRDSPVAPNDANSCAFCNDLSFPCVVTHGTACIVMRSCRERTMVDMNTGAGAIVDTLCR